MAPGTALTAMRSDASPPLDQSIAPTMTGSWFFTNAIPITIISAEPRFLYSETGVAADEGLWDVDINAKTFKIRTRTDVDGTGVDCLAFLRGTGTALATVTIGNSTNPANFVFAGGGTVSCGNLTSVSGTLTGANIVATGTFVPSTGLNRPGANRLGFCSNTLLRGEFTAAGDLSLAVANFLLSFTAALPNNAAANLATLTNAPTAGDPTKWIPINDNGTTRNIPAW